MDDFLTLKLNKEFRRLYGRGNCVVTPTIVMYSLKNRCGVNRIGITTAKKIGNAVKRNRARRVIRVSFRNLKTQLNENYDIVFVARTKTTFVKEQVVERDMINCFVKSGMIDEKGID
jgi:ribonuclease P protein component